MQPGQFCPKDRFWSKPTLDRLSASVSPKHPRAPETVLYHPRLFSHPTEIRKHQEMKKGDTQKYN